MCNNSFWYFLDNAYLCIVIMNKVKRYKPAMVAACTLLLVAIPLASSGQGRSRGVRSKKAATEEKWQKRFTDSLAACRDSIYSDSCRVRPLPDIETAPFFLPMTFYRDVARHAFSLDGKLSDNDRKLLSVYLNHPELVRNTQESLEAAGPAIAPKTVTGNPSAVVKKSAPQEPDALPLDVVVLKPNFWTFGGDYYLQLLQNYLTDNWYQGGESNYSLMGQVKLVANYNNKQKVRWDNTLEMKYGLQTTRSDTVHKTRPTEDLIRYTGKLGLQATRQWYYTFQLIAQTQWARHYSTNSSRVQSDFFSPFNLNLSVGMDYNVRWLKNRLTGSVHLAPLAYNFKYCGRLALSARNGIDAGKHSLNDFGSQTTVSLNWKFSDNASWSTRLYWYTTYKRTEAEWENTFSFQFNRYLATKVFLYPRFDDGVRRDADLGYWMFKEFVSVGFSYSF